MHIFIHKTNYNLFKKRIDKKYRIDIEIKDGGVQMLRLKKNKKKKIYL